MEWAADRVSVPLIGRLLSNKRHADCAVGREQAAKSNGRVIGMKSAIDLTIGKPGREGGGGVNKSRNAQTGVACRGEDRGRDGRVFLTGARSNQNPDETDRPGNAAVMSESRQQRAGGHRSRYVLSLSE